MKQQLAKIKSEALSALAEAKAAAGQVCRPSWDDGIYHALRELAVI